VVQDILKISVFQFDLAWENIKANLSKIDQMLKRLPAGTDIVFLPEMFSTGFTTNAAKVAESMSGETMNWIRQRCVEYQTAICGSLVIQEEGKYFNRLVFVDPDGKVSQYDKRHLFTMAGEESCYSKGENRLIVEYKGWRICPLICYDLRFPVWSRNLNNYDLLVYSANWPEPRALVWNTLLKARAIENQSYVVGVNRVGTDGNKISYLGQSQMIDAKGNVIALAQDNREEIRSTPISFTELLNFRKKFPVLNDSDDFCIEK
jgi:predicted amidohydrolase